MAFIYIVTNVDNGKVYIGQTLRTADARWRSHLVQARRGDNEYFHRAIRSYGEKSFVCRMLEEVPDDVVNEREIALITFYQSTDRDKGYNVAAGGRHAKHTLETRKAMSERMKGNKCGLGKIPTAEHRMKISIANKGRIGVHLGKKFSEATRRKMSEARQGRIVSPETCAKISEAKKGVRMADEAIRRAAISRTGLKRTEETKQKMSEARRLWWERKQLHDHQLGALWTLPKTTGNSATMTSSVSTLANYSRPT